MAFVKGGHDLLAGCGGLVDVLGTGMEFRARIIYLYCLLYVNADAYLLIGAFLTGKRVSPRVCESNVQDWNYLTKE
jgi:hypothetical protein